MSLTKSGLVLVQLRCDGNEIFIINHGDLLIDFRPYEAINCFIDNVTEIIMECRGHALHYDILILKNKNFKKNVSSRSLFLHS